MQAASDDLQAILFYAFGPGKLLPDDEDAAFWEPFYAEAGARENE